MHSFHGFYHLNVSFHPDLLANIRVLVVSLGLKVHTN